MSESRPPPLMPAGANTSSDSWSWQLGHVLGIPIRIHVTASIVIVLVAMSVSGLLQEWHPDWSTLVIVVSAGLAAVLFFVSLLLHELSHSLIAVARGTNVKRITLFLFGGVAEIEGEPKTPQDEFLIALAGPLASFVLAGAFLLAATLLADTPTLAPPEDTPFDLSQLSAPVTVCLWLSAINFILATFNLLPGFPLDGGRLFRAAVWWYTGDYQRATRVAAAAGSMIGWMIIGGGLLYIFNGYLGNGIWCLMIGWFVRQLANLSVHSAHLQHALKNLRTDQLMRTHFEQIDKNMPLADFLDNYVMRSKQWLWPVDDGSGTAAFISVNQRDLASTPDEQMLFERLTQATEANSIAASTPAVDALQQLASASGPMPVMQNGQIVGLLDHADVSRWLMRHWDT